jgi:hypothetical protein
VKSTRRRPWNSTTTSHLPRRSGSRLRADLASTYRLIVRGQTVPKFFTALLDHLLDLGAPLDKKLPVRAGRIRYLLADEPYHANARRFDTYIERNGYFMNTSFSYEQAMAHARMLCEELGLQATPLDGVVDEPQDVSVPLRIEIDGQTFHADDVPAFLFEVVTALYEKGILSDADIPYKSGRVRYFIAESPFTITAGHSIGPLRSISAVTDTSSRPTSAVKAPSSWSSAS